MNPIDHASFARSLAVAAIAAPALVALPASAGETDYDLYMMRLVNRARVDPAGEAARIGSSVVDTSAPVPPLAYSAFVDEAARNHTNWMHDNLGNINAGCVPDSFTHRETWDCTSGGAPATGSPSFTGANVGNRLDFVGYAWSQWAENIIASWSTATISINQARIDLNHLGWWESSGHRNNMLSANPTVFGHHIEARTFAPPLGGIPAPFDNLHFATQNFSRPLSFPRTHVFGLLYEDMDGNDEWTPRPEGHSAQEGLANVGFTVFAAGGSTVVASGTTLANGAFAAPVPDGTYDVAFDSGHAVNGVTVNGENIDVGDLSGAPCIGDTNNDGMVDIDDVINAVLDFGTDGSANGGDADMSGIVDIDDVVLIVLNFGMCPGA